VQHIPLGGLLEWDAAAPTNNNTNTETTTPTTPTTPTQTVITPPSDAQMSTSPLETVVPSRTRTRIQARPKAQGQGRGTPPLPPLISTTTTATIARVPWDTTAPGGESGTTRAPWPAAMPMMNVAGSSGSGSGSGSMGPPRLPRMDIGGRGRRGVGDHDVGGGLG
jgi:hypothetical protein